MLLRNVFVGLASAVIFFSITGYTQSAGIADQKIRVCNNEHCMKTSELIDVSKYKNESVLITHDEKKEEENTTIVDYMTLVMTGIIPTFGFIWWLLNSQQERKIIEFSQSQDIKFKTLMKEVIDKQDETTKEFGSELKELGKKIDIITQSFQEARLDYVERLSDQKEKIANLMLEVAALKKYMDKIDNIEGFLNKQFDEYHIRK